MKVKICLLCIKEIDMMILSLNYLKSSLKNVRTAANIKYGIRYTREALRSIDVDQEAIERSQKEKNDILANSILFK